VKVRTAMLFPNGIFAPCFLRPLLARAPNASHHRVNGRRAGGEKEPPHFRI
jgi:hypothetical protein